MTSFAMNLGVRSLRTVSAIGLVVALSGCDEYTCLDTATCAAYVGPDAAVSTGVTATGGDTLPDESSSSSPPAAPSDSETERPSASSTSSDVDEPIANTSPSSDVDDGSTSSSPPAVDTTTDEVDQDSTSTVVEKLLDGTGCNESSQCESGFCVDGVCCESACSGVCAACDVAGAEGTCAAPESDSDCAPVSCPADTECLTYEALSTVASCTALNSCLEAASCQATPEGSGTPCQSGAGECDGEGECVVPNKKTLGDTCASGDECGSGECAARADGVSICCDGACDGVCQACSSAGHCDEKPADDSACGVIDCPSDTSCADYATDVDSNRCASFGQCKTQASECSVDFTDSGTSCGTGKICDGSGTCANCPTQTGASRICTPECPCDAGEGGCSAHTQCSAGLVCVTGGAIKYGFSGNTCLPTHCDNDIIDAGETGVDCGGDCGCGATLDTLETYFYLHGISDDGGTVVGFTTGNYKAAYIWETTGTYSAFASGYQAWAISGDGRVIVGSGTEGAVRWVNRGQPQLLAANSVAYWASRNGSVIVGTGSGSTGGFVWSNGTSTTVQGFGYFDQVTADGKLVIGPKSADGTMAFWSSTTGESAATPPGGGSLQGAAFGSMSPNGRYITGLAELPSGVATIVWDRTAGTVTQLQNMPPNTSTPTAASVTDSGLVVGQEGRNTQGMYWSPSDGYQPHSFLEFMASFGVELPPEATLAPVVLVTPDGKSFAGEMFGGDERLWRLRVK